MEIWKDISENYKVSNLGRVWSVKRKGKTKDVILKPNKDTGGYLYVRLYHNKKSICPKIHRLVALAFIPNPENKRCVNHKDFDIKNNSVYNLEWVNDQNNAIYRRPSKNGTSKYKGVHKDKKSGKYIAQIQFNKKNNYLGRFSKETDAALAYNKAAKILFGTYAVFNEVA